MALVELTDAEKALRKPNGDQMEPKDFIICPLTFKVTHGQSAVNYDISPTTMKISGEDVPAWRSQPQDRGHAGLFKAGLQALKDKGLIPETWVAYFFPDEQGRQARVAYEDKVMKGESRANRRSWGPNVEGDQKPDKSRFHILVTRERVDEFNVRQRAENPEWVDLTYPVTYDQLAERYPKLYLGGSSAQKKKEAAAAAPEASLDKVPDLDLGSLSDDEIMEKIEGSHEEEAQLEASEPDPEELEIIEEADAVAASTVLEDPTLVSDESVEEEAADTATAAPPLTAEQLESARTGNIPASEVRSGSTRTEEGQKVKFDLTDQSLKAQMVSSDVITWKGQSGDLETRYLVYVDALSREEWLGEGTTVIDGEDVDVKINRK